MRGDARALRHFDAEYAEAARGEDGSSPAVEVGFGRERERAVALIAGGHKTVRWRIALGGAASSPLTAHVGLRGAPRSFALSLVQGYFVESLIAIAAARAGHVLLPAAALGQSGGALVMLGASGTGKSSISVRALGAGACVLGDDQILVDRDGSCFRFPRRMRFYSDLRLTAPAVWARLPQTARRALQARRVVRVLSRGLVAPSLPLAAHVIGDPGSAGPLQAVRFVLIERAASVHDLTLTPVAADEAVAQGLALLASQRERFAAGIDESWRAALDEVAELERAILVRAFARAPIERLAVPHAWDAARAIPELAAALGTER
ncbi:MAG: hypothetical protein KY463_15550 [Actinobacteria bacterium]|nr:hypothetical protein [Actinomycetota bacterium]